MVGVPLSSIARISSKRLKPPQKTAEFSGIENKLPNKQTNKQSKLAVEAMDEIEIMHNTVASIRYDPVVIHNCLEELDHVLTSKMLTAKDEVSPSKTACSHEWSPALVQMQQKANLLQQAI